MPPLSDMKLRKNSNKHPLHSIGLPNTDMIFLTTMDTKITHLWSGVIPPSSPPNNSAAKVPLSEVSMNLAALALSVDTRNRTRSVIPPFCGRTIRYLEMSEVEEELGLNWVVAIFNTPCCWCWGGFDRGFLVSWEILGWVVQVVGFNIGVYMWIDTTLIYGWR